MEIQDILDRLDAIERVIDERGDDIEHDEDCECDCLVSVNSPVRLAVAALKLDLEIDLRRKGIALVKV